jgi:hypothetical protein
MASATGRWINHWKDESGDADRDILISADSVEELKEGLRRVLGNKTYTPDIPDDLKVEGEDDEPQPAYEAFLDNEFGPDVDADILKLWCGVTFQCDDGRLHVVRER